jgi:hypothetical protein
MSSSFEEDRVRSVIHEMLQVGGTARPPVEPSELRRRVRWSAPRRIDPKLLVVMAAAAILIVALFAANPLKKTPVVGKAPATGHVTAGHSFFAVRPVLCGAPAAGPQATMWSGIIAPSCSPASQLSTTNLNVQAGPHGSFSYDSHVPVDSALASTSSTSPSQDAEFATQTVLLPSGPPGLSALSFPRFLVGPAGVTGTSVRSVSAIDQGGGWAISIALTPNGAVGWDALTNQQFHGLIGIDLDGQILLTLIVQPTRTSWTSANGKVVIAGDYSHAEAQTIVHEIARSR